MFAYFPILWGHKEKNAPLKIFRKLVVVVFWAYKNVTFEKIIICYFLFHHQQQTWSENRVLIIEGNDNSGLLYGFPRFISDIFTSAL